jgi:shikimate kinase/3-dehydroquinate synthase
MPDPQSTSNDLKSRIFLYGPPGSGKTSLGKQLADELRLPFYDLDERIQSQARMSIPEIFNTQEEAGFRKLERDELNKVLRESWGVISLGGGALLSPENRNQVESRGTVLCLSAPSEVLLERLQKDSEQRPLLNPEEKGKGPTIRLKELLATRREHYASFPMQMNTARGSVDELAWQAEILLGAFHVSAMAAPASRESGSARPRGYDVRVQERGLDALGKALCKRDLHGPVAVVSDENVAGIYLHRALKSLQEADYSYQPIIVPPGEASKDISTLTFLWEAFVELDLERGSTVVALGGGVIGDLAGFAAATFKRGVSWVVAPTSLLAMVDASLGGKTGIDLPRGKNLAGAFHAPRLVLSDPSTLSTLPEPELVSGMAEVVKAGVIGDPELFHLCGQGWETVQEEMNEIVRRAMAVKIKIIEVDPFEHGQRAALNLGHTVGHAVELVTNFGLKHGEAVAIGLLAETRLAERTGLAEKGLAGEVERVLAGLQLPTEIPPGLDRGAMIEAMQVDKKRAGGKVRFALPVKIGEVRVGMKMDDLERAIFP